MYYSLLFFHLLTASTIVVKCCLNFKKTNLIYQANTVNCFSPLITAFLRKTRTRTHASIKQLCINQQMSVSKQSAEKTSSRKPPTSESPWNEASTKRSNYRIESNDNTANNQQKITEATTKTCSNNCYKAKMQLKRRMPMHAFSTHFSSANPLGPTTDVSFVVVIVVAKANIRSSVLTMWQTCWLVAVAAIVVVVGAARLTFLAVGKCTLTPHLTPTHTRTANAQPLMHVLLNCKNCIYAWLY